MYLSKRLIHGLIFTIAASAMACGGSDDSDEHDDSEHTGPSAKRDAGKDASDAGAGKDAGTSRSSGRDASVSPTATGTDAVDDDVSATNGVDDADAGRVVTTTGSGRADAGATRPSALRCDTSACSTIIDQLTSAEPAAAGMVGLCCVNDTTCGIDIKAQGMQGCLDPSGFVPSGPTATPRDAGARNL